MMSNYLCFEKDQLLYVLVVLSGTRQSLEMLRQHVQLPTAYPRSAAAILMQKMSQGPQTQNQIGKMVFLLTSHAYHQTTS